MQDLFISFHENLRFTVDRFEIEVSRFLGIKMSAQGLTVYRINTHTGKLVHYDGFTSWNFKIKWVRYLVKRAKHICSINLLPEELNERKNFAS